MADMIKNNRHKYYVVWHGAHPGIYTSWEECRIQVKGFAGAIYKSYPTADEATKAFASSPPVRITQKASDYSSCNESPQTLISAHKRMTRSLPPNPPSDRTDTVLPLPLAVRADAWAVDAACSGNPGQMEYRGVCLRTGQVVFHYGPIYGTNNVGEFLAIVHALALIKGRNLRLAVYSDSRNALLWVRQKKCKTRLARNARTETLFQLIDRAEKWLRENTYDTPLLKWETQLWGEVPADFGRK